jgi:hypothetical protein
MFPSSSLYLSSRFSESPTGRASASGVLKPVFVVIHFFAVTVIVIADNGSISVIGGTELQGFT